MRTSLLVISAFLCFGLCAPSPAQTTVQNDWEDGTLQGWIPRGGSVVLTNTAEAAHGGTRSLKTTGRTAGYNGPSLDLLPVLANGATYQITAWVRMAPGTADSGMRMTMQRTPAGGSNAFDSIAASAGNVTSAAWVQLSGLYAYSGNVSGLLMYIEAADATTSYYIDDFNITLISGAPGPPLNTNGLASTFESGTTEGWGSRIGVETVTNSIADAHSGTHSLLTTGRTAPYEGPNLDVSNIMFNGSRYLVSLWVKLAPGEAPNQLRVSLQRNAGSVTTYHTVINNTNVTANQWVRLAAVFDVALANSSLFLYVESNSSSVFPSFYIDDVQVTFVPPPQIQQDLPSLYASLASYFPVGTAVDPATITGVHGQLLAKHFNSITPGNDIKWDATEPVEGRFQFANADAEVAFAKANHMLIRGHTLLWHQQLPGWVFQDANQQPLPVNDASKALVLQRVRNHIQGVVTHFGQDIYAWDVINEAIDATQPDCLRRSNWYTYTGKDFIDTAFLAARQFAPNAKLFYNDYDTTNTSPNYNRRQCLVNLVSDMKSRGIPIDAVGHQFHNNLNYPSPQDFIDTVHQLAAFGVDQQVTEMDISIGNTYSFYPDISPSVFNLQGYRYRDYFNALRQLRGLISSVTLWGMADDNTWLSTGSTADAPLLFDQSLQAKPAFWGILDPHQLPGSALTGSVPSKAGPQNARVWTVQMSNPGPGVSTQTQIGGFLLTQTSGTPCAPIVNPGTFPVVLGDIPAGSSASAAFTIDFSACSNLAQFTVNVPYGAMAGGNTGAIVLSKQYR